MSGAKDDPEYPYDRDKERADVDKADARRPGADAVERASCQHMVQSSGMCGMGGCPNYGNS